MADSFNKKEREKKRQKRKKDKAERKAALKLAPKETAEFMYLDEDGNLTAEKPDPALRKKASLADIEISTRKKDKSGDPNLSKFTKLGVVKFFNTEKGYGFIDAQESAQSYFVHIDNLRDKVKEGDKVTFEVGKGPKGPIAVDVKLYTD